MSIEDVIKVIEGVLTAKSIEERNQIIDNVLDDVPLDKNKIREFENDIEELRVEAHNLDSPISVSIIQEIITKYKLE